MDNKALKWLIIAGTQKDTIKSSVFFYGLVGLFKSKANKKKLLYAANRYATIVESVIPKKKKRSDKLYCLLLFRNMYALKHDLPLLDLPKKKINDAKQFKKLNPDHIISKYLFK